MRIRRTLMSALLLPVTALASAPLQAAEYGISTYALGGNAFGAGATPPPGLYTTSVYGFYSGDFKTTVNFDRVTLTAGAHLQYVTSATNILYVVPGKMWGGNLGMSVTVPVGRVDIDATISAGPLTRSSGVDGWGLGDIVPKAQLGWHHGDFSHTLYLQVVTPTGKWDPGFSPIIGMNRPGVDTGWAFTWADKRTKIQVNGAAGFTFNFENTDTNYKSGSEFHFEWAIGYEMSPGLVVGVVGYDYRQLSGDSGAGALLGDFKGSVDAIGPGISYTTLFRQMPIILNVRHYQEYNVDHRWEGSSTLFTSTVRF
jgi:hypothetical protein